MSVNCKKHFLFLILIMILKNFFKFSIIFHNNKNRQYYSIVQICNYLDIYLKILSLV